MNDIYSLDYETFSEADLKKYGAYRYGADPSTEILIFAIAKNDERPLVWDVLDSFGENAAALLLLQKALIQEALIYAHNAQFEAAISKYLFRKTFIVHTALQKNRTKSRSLYPPKLEQWRCTAAMARRAAIPSSLGGVGEFLGLDVTKPKFI
jgi:DNA polymerase